MSGVSRTPEEANDRFLYPASLALIVAALVAAIALLPRILPHAKEFGGEAPDVTVPMVANAEGKTNFHLNEERGHPVLIDFWATWCGPCKAESPIVNRIAARYKDRGLVTLGINTSDEPGVAAEYVKSHGLSFPMAYDTGNIAAHAFEVQSLPTLVLISKTGKLIAVRMGITSDDEVDRLVRGAL